MTYRKEIDGLRALAVIPVILFHGGFEWFSGGYVGVDIFFVISGYLITSIILKEKQANTFSLVNFYERRARRILPALFFVLLISLPFAWFLLLPHELIDFGESLIAVSLFSSNILFWQSSGYFAADAELIPLLHTWSLAVEEQFYVFFPLLIMLLWPVKRYWLMLVIVVIALLSLGLAEWGWREFPDANFYLIPTRAWELMIGALVAFYLYYNDQPKGSICQIASIVGFGLIIYAILFLDKTVPFPSVYALMPTLGTALIILYAKSGTLVNLLLSLKPMVSVGLISYSAYLWHLPLFVFARMTYVDGLPMELVALLSIESLVFGYLSWRFIERPFRNKQGFTRKQIFTTSFIMSAMFIAIGTILAMSDGFDFRLS